jgi:uncharacterized protein YceK
MKTLILVMVVMVLAGCASNRVTVDTYKQNYSIEVESDIADTISSGLPEGVNAINVNKSILADTVSGLEQDGLMGNKKDARIKIKCNLKYLAHKWGGLIKVKYLMTYNVQAIDNSTGKVVAYDQIEIDDTSLSDAMKKASKDIIDFAENSVKKL